MAIDAFRGTTPLFLPERFFVGRLEGWAVLESLVGGLLRRATIVGHGELDADTDTVLFIETYTFDDGHSDTLHWTIRKGEEGKYTGLENRLEGDAIGEQAGCAFHWKYTRDTPQGGGKSFKLNFDDWFYGMSIGPLIAVCCQATILPLSSDTPVAIAPSELVRLRRRSDRGWRDDCLAGLAIDVVGGFSGLG